MRTPAQGTGPIAHGCPALARLVLAALPAFLALCPPVVSASPARSGAWTLEASGRPGMVQLQIHGGDANHNWSNSWTTSTVELEGLTLEQLEAKESEARFRIRRDAGTLDFQGQLREGSGGGSFEFLPSAEFLEGMKQLGYSDITLDENFSMCVHDVSRGFVRDLAALGYQRVSKNKLLELRIQAVTPEYIKGMRDLGFARLTLAQATQMRIQGVTPEYARRMRGAADEWLSPEQLIQLKIRGATPGQLSRTGHKSL